jgi:putative iron-dependent peroxidase
MAGFGADLAALARMLDLRRIALMGWSGGGQYAVAAAAGALGDRVRSLSLLASLAPDDEVPWVVDEFRPWIAAVREDPVRALAATHELVSAVAGLREPQTTMGGVNIVAGFRPELWREVTPDDAPAGVDGFNHDLVGSDGYVIPATQHDAVLWLSGSAFDVVFDVARQAIATLDRLAVVAEDTSSWPYRYDRDLTGFIDGTENPTLIDAPEIALIPNGSPGAGGTILLLQKWSHDATAWESQPVARQEQVIGRTKPDSVELEDRPADSHASRTDQDQFGKIFRRNTPYGTVTDHGTMFVGFSADQRRLIAMLESMAGLTDGGRDALTYYTRPLTGAYYLVPSNEAIRRAAGDA